VKKKKGICWPLQDAQKAKQTFDGFSNKKRKPVKEEEEGA